MDSGECFSSNTFFIADMAFIYAGPGNKRDDNSTFEPPRKRSRKRLIVNLTTSASLCSFEWCSVYNLDENINCSKVEIGDGATSRVYLGDIDGKKVAVKQLKCYSARFAPVLVKVYEPLLNLQHENVVKLLGICPQAAQIVLEYCEKKLGKLVLHTLGDLLLHLGNNFPQELQLNALADIAEGLHYIHNQGIVHGDIKPQNVLVCGEGEFDYTFKLADYACNNVEHMYTSSKSSSSLRQLMTPGYAAPEIFSDVGSHLQPTNKSDIYSFGILAYEVVFQKEAWPNVIFN